MTFRPPAPRICTLRSGVSRCFEPSMCDGRGALLGDVAIPQAPEHLEADAGVSMARSRRRKRCSRPRSRTSARRPEHQGRCARMISRPAREARPAPPTSAPRVPHRHEQRRLHTRRRVEATARAPEQRFLVERSKRNVQGDQPASRRRRRRSGSGATPPPVAPAPAPDRPALTTSISSVERGGGSWSAARPPGGRGAGGDATGASRMAREAAQRIRVAWRTQASGQVVRRTQRGGRRAPRRRRLPGRGSAKGACVRGEVVSAHREEGARPTSSVSYARPTPPGEHRSALGGEVSAAVGAATEPASAR